jgi:hypothetical protein
MFKFISMSCLKLDLLEFATSVNGHYVFLCSSWHQCHARSLMSLNLLQVLIVIVLFLCSSLHQCHVWSLISLDLLQVFMVVMFFYVPSLHQCHARSLVSLNLLQVLVVQIHFNVIPTMLPFAMLGVIILFNVLTFIFVQILFSLIMMLFQRHLE